MAEIRPQGETLFLPLNATDSRPLRTSERIARQLIEHITVNDLPPGTRLPGEAQLIETLGVSRGSLREALRLLESRGVILMRQGSQGGVVRWPRAADLGDALSLILQFEKASLADVLAARQVLEPALARNAATAMDDDGIATLDDSSDRIRADLADLSVFRSESARFHNTIADASGLVSRILCESLMAVTLMVATDETLRTVSYDTDHRASVADAHERIAVAISQHDGDAADRLMREHLDSTRAYWLATITEASSRTVHWWNESRTVWAASE